MNCTCIYVAILNPVHDEQDLKQKLFILFIPVVLTDCRLLFFPPYSTNTPQAQMTEPDSGASFQNFFFACVRGRQD